MSRSACTRVALDARDMPSWMLARLGHETRPHHIAAAEDRLAPLMTPTTRDGYRDYLTRILGFEAPLEAALAATPGLADVIELAPRLQAHLLEGDVAALGADPAQVPRCRIAPFSSIAEALGWLYVHTYGTQLHGQVRRHLERRLPHAVADAGAYLRASESRLGARMTALGTALDTFTTTAELGMQVIRTAQAGFRRQRQWFAQWTAQPVGIAR